MAFDFDKLRKTVTGAGQQALAKTKEIADTSRLKSMISEEEKLIDSHYYQIGKLYASLHRNDSEEEFSSMIAAITESEIKIRDYKKQIQDIKGVQRCEKCGAEVSKGAAFCSSCGAAMPKLAETVPDDTIRCENCGAMVKSGMLFCASCGKPIALPNPPIKLSNEKVCPCCGAKIEEDVAFCTECGSKL